MQINVWTLPNCVQCMQTKKVLDREGISFEEFNLAEYPEKIDEFKELGLTSAPIVETDIKKWSGFRLDKIKSLANYLFGEKKTHVHNPQPQVVNA